MKPETIYTVEIVAYPLEACWAYASGDAPEHLHGSEVATVPTPPSGYLAYLDPDWSPKDWDADDAFFWPSTGFVYRSRSAAMQRKRLIESYGAKAVAYEAEPTWLDVEAAAQNRRIERARARAQKLRGEADRIEYEAAVRNTVGVIA